MLEDPEMTATEAQIQELANTIALQAEALAGGKVDSEVLYAHIRRITDNAETLKAWTAHLKPEPVSQNRVIAVTAVNKVEASGVLDDINQRELDLIDSTPASVRVSPKDVVEFCPYCGITNGGHTRNCGRP